MLVAVVVTAFVRTKGVSGVVKVLVVVVGLIVGIVLDEGGIVRVAVLVRQCLEW